MMCACCAQCTHHVLRNSERKLLYMYEWMLQVLHGACVLMPWCDCICCRETLRRDPVVSGLMRVAARDFEVSGYKVPAGKMLILPLKYLSANDARWVNEAGELSPDAFVPERMMTADAQKTGDLLPFGYGPRCGPSGLRKTTAAAGCGW